MLHSKILKAIALTTVLLAASLMAGCSTVGGIFKSKPKVKVAGERVAVLVNEADRAEIKGVLVRSEGYIRRNNFWVGWEDALKV